MKHRYVFAGLVCLFSLSAFGQSNLFRGNWYAGTDLGIFSSRTRMSAGELGKYTPGSSGVMPLYGLKVGRIINPSLSVETGVYALPINLVYLYETDRAVGASPLHFVAFPLRANWRVRVFHDQLEAHLGGGLQYVWASSQLSETHFSGIITQKVHAGIDSLIYAGTATITRRGAVNAEVSASLNWSLSRRWTLSISGRQIIGLMNVARVKVAIKNNQEPSENAEFVTRGTGFNAGIGIRYNLGF